MNVFSCHASCFCCWTNPSYCASSAGPHTHSGVKQQRADKMRVQRHQLLLGRSDLASSQSRWSELV
eukprot:6904947-Karenia_brevis.AAC.1